MLKPQSCKPCSLYSISNGFIRPEGQGRKQLALIGEAGGYDEFIDGLPFRPQAQSGSLLEKVLKEELGLTRDDVWITNILHCQPPKNLLTGQWYAESAIKCCEQYRNKEIDEWKPKAIVALGGTAFETLTGETLRIVEDDIAGHLFWLKKGEYVSQENKEDGTPWGTTKHIIKGNIPVIPTYHPSYIRRGNMHLTSLLAYDIARALRISKDEWLSPTEYNKKKNYRIVGHDEAQSFYYKLKDNPKLILAFDIETDFSKTISEDMRDDAQELGNEITQIQFATDKYNAVIFPHYSGSYKYLSKLIMELPNFKANHNAWNFDNPRIKASGVKIDETRVHDTMWMFKHYQPKLPRGLQRVACLADFPFAWKHLFNTNVEEYGGADVCSIHFILEWLPKLMKAKSESFPNPFTNVPLVVNTWEGYVNHVFKYHPILQDASDDGLPVNNEARIELDGVLRDKYIILDKGIQKIIPDEIKNLAPTHKIKVVTPNEFVVQEVDKLDVGYVREPKKLLKTYREKYERLVSPNLFTANKPTMSFDRFLYLNWGLCQKEVEGFNRKTGKSLGLVTRWVRVLPFKGSKEQLSRYIEHKAEVLSKSTNKEEKKLAKLYVVPTDARGKETTRKDEIEILFDKTGDEVLQTNIEMRSIVTNRRNYIPNWKPNETTGAVHTHWNFSPPTGQMTSYQPNVLNVSKHTEIGQAFRKIIEARQPWNCDVEAPEGWEFIELDKKSFHVAMMGYVANSEKYIRFSQLDPHSIYCSYIVNGAFGIKPITMDQSDSDILEQCKFIKKTYKRLAEEGKKDYLDVRQKQAKPTVLGHQLGLGYRKLFWQNRRSIESEKRAKELQATLDAFDERVVQAKSDVKWNAHKRGFRMNEFGRIQWFHDVWSKTFNKKVNKWEMRDGSEARLPIAFAVQSTSFGMILEELFRILKRVRELDKPLGYKIFRMSIHDSLVFLQRVEDRDLLLPIYLEEMKKPCKQLVNEATGPEGLRIDIEWSAGKNLQAYDKEKNPEGMREMG